MKKLLALMLAVFMLVSVVAIVASCESGDEPAKTTKADPVATTKGGSSATEPVETQEATTKGEETPATQEVTGGGSEPTVPTSTTSGGGSSAGGDGYSKPDGYLDVDFGGRTFSFVTTSDWSDEVGRWNTEREIAVESRTGGTIIDTAVYDRNAVMKKLYNCEIKATEGEMALITNDINSGTNEYDFGSAEYMQFATSTSGYYINLYDLNLDMNLPGWNKAMFDQMTVRDANGVDKLYVLDADFNVVGYRGTWVLYCNLDLYNQNFSESIFDIVNKGEWTVDKMSEMITAVAQDNGDQTWKAGDDTFGLMSSTYNSIAFITSMGIRLVSVDENHNFSTSVDQILANNAVEAINKAGELYALNGIYVGSYATAADELQAGRTLFIGEVLDVLERMKDNENLNVTVLPAPLYQAEENPTYKFYVQNKTSYYKVSKNACGGDKEMISDFLNVFVYHSNKIVYPAFRQTYGSVYCQDERAMEMLDYIIAGRQYDLGYYKGNVMGQIMEMIHGNKNQMNRAANSFVKTLNGFIDTLVDETTKSE